MLNASIRDIDRSVYACFNVGELSSERARTESKLRTRAKALIEMKISCSVKQAVINAANNFPLKNNVGSPVNMFLYSVGPGRKFLTGYFRKNKTANPYR